jgi:hypothetical protein
MSIAALGSIFASSLRRSLSHALSSVPALASHASSVVAQIRQGDPGQAIAAAPASLRGQLELAIRSSFASSVDDILVVTAILAFVGAAGSLLLIRRKDFLVRQPQSERESNRDALATAQ